MEETLFYLPYWGGGSCNVKVFFVQPHADMSNYEEKTGYSSLPWGELIELMKARSEEGVGDPALTETVSARISEVGMDLDTRAVSGLTWYMSRMANVPRTAFEPSRNVVIARAGEFVSCPADFSRMMRAISKRTRCRDLVVKLHKEIAAAIQQADARSAAGLLDAIANQRIEVPEITKAIQDRASQLERIEDLDMQARGWILQSFARIGGDVSRFVEEAVNVTTKKLVFAPSTIEQKTAVSVAWATAVLNREYACWLLNQTSSAWGRMPLTANQLRALYQASLFSGSSLPWAVKKKALNVLNQDQPTPNSFETDVHVRLVKLGWDVQAQVPCQGFFLDNVASKGSRRVVVECDGDRYHYIQVLGAARREPPVRRHRINAIRKSGYGEIRYISDSTWKAYPEQERSLLLQSILEPRAA